MIYSSMKAFGSKYLRHPRVREGLFPACLIYRPVYSLFQQGVQVCLAHPYLKRFEFQKFLCPNSINAKIIGNLLTINKKNEIKMKT